MQYEQVKKLIQKELSKKPRGVTWAELSEALKLPYKRLCPEWTLQLEKEIGLLRKKSEGRAYVWSLSSGERDA